MAHDDLTDDSYELEVLDSEHETSPSSASTAPSRSGAQAGLLLLSGFGCALFGLALSVGPLASWKAAQVMVGLDYLGVHGGTLFVGGLVMMGLGMLRRGQHAIAVNADEVNGDTAVLEEMATDVVQMRNALDHMQRVTGQMQDEVGELRRFCEAEANKQAPVQQAPQGDAQGDAVFRLAATIDKLGARIEERMKGQFQSLQERLTSVESGLETSQESLEGRLEQLARNSLPDATPEMPAAPEFSPAPVHEPAPLQNPAPVQELPQVPVQELPPVPAPEVAEPQMESPLGVLDLIEPDAPEVATPQPAPDADFSQGLNLADVHQPGPTAALPSGDPASPWGGELQMEAPEAPLSPEERERLLAETRLRQSLQNMQRHPEQGTQDFGG